MSENPILFNSEIVTAILDGRKTQTRRVIKPKPELRPGKMVGPLGNQISTAYWHYKNEWWWSDPQPSTLALCPYGQPGDRLWVRETWATISHYDHLAPSCVPKGDARWPKVWYAAPEIAAASIKNTSSEFVGKVRPSIHMPRWASRITLQIKAVRVERVQSITEADAWAEGIECVSDPVGCFEDLWDSINAKRGHGWASNPWVWVVEFEASR